MRAIECPCGHHLEGTDDEDLFRRHSGACFTSLDDGAQARLREDARRRLGSPEGPFALTARAWWARGVRP